MLGALVSKDPYSFVSQGNVKFREISLTALECNLAGFYLILKAKFSLPDAILNAG